VKKSLGKRPSLPQKHHRRTVPPHTADCFGAGKCLVHVGFVPNECGTATA
jgi:hypothetical protein